MQGNSKTEENKAFRRACKNFRNPISVLRKFCYTINALRKFRNTTNALRKFHTTTSTLQKYHNPKSRLRKFLQPHKHLAKILQGLPTIRKTVLPCEIHVKFALRIPIASMWKGNGQWEANGQQESQKSLKILFKDLKSFCLFRTTHSLLRKAQLHLTKQFSLHSTPRGHQFEEATSTSCLISAMARIRGGHTDPSVAREARPIASAPQDSSQAPQAPTVPSFEGGVLITTKKVHFHNFL